MCNRFELLRVHNLLRRVSYEAGVITACEISFVTSVFHFCESADRTTTSSSCDPIAVVRLGTDLSISSRVLRE